MHGPDRKVIGHLNDFKTSCILFGCYLSFLASLVMVSYLRGG